MSSFQRREVLGDPRPRPSPGALGRSSRQSSQLKSLMVVPSCQLCPDVASSPWEHQEGCGAGHQDETQLSHWTNLSRTERWIQRDMGLHTGIQAFCFFRPVSSLHRCLIS